MSKIIEDDRRNQGRFTFMGFTKGQLITISIAFLAVISGLFTQYQVFGGVLNQVTVNTIADVKTNKRITRLETSNQQLHLLIQQVKDDLIKRMDQQDKYRREDMKEIRKIVRKRDNEKY